MELRTKNSKLKVLGKEKEGELPDQKLEVGKLKNNLRLDKEICKRINLDLTRMRSDLEKANKWTRSSMIATHLGNNNRNVKIGIGYEQPINGNPTFCIVSGSSSHSKQYCPEYKTYTEENNSKRTYKLFRGTSLFLKTVCQNGLVEILFILLIKKRTQSSLGS